MSSKKRGEPNRSGKKKRHKRSKGRPSNKRHEFLAAFSVCGNVRHACEIAQCSSTRVYELLKTDPEFIEKFDAAKEEAVQRLEQEARRRAERGVQRLKFTNRGELITVPDPSGKTEKVKRKVRQGKKWVEIEEERPAMVPYVEHVYSDTLMIFLLKSYRPDIYRELVHHTGRVDSLNANIDFNGRQLPTPEEAISQLESTLDELYRLHGTKRLDSNGDSSAHQNGDGPVE